MQAHTVRRSGDGCCFLFLALALFAPTTRASQIIAVSGTTNLSSGFVNLACTDLTVAGVLDTGTGTYANVRNVTVTPSGIIQGAGSIRYSGTLSTQGTIQPGVQLIVNPPTNVACPGPLSVDPTAAPTLGNSMLVALATLLLLLAVSALRAQAVPRRQSEENGVDR